MEQHMFEGEAESEKPYGISVERGLYRRIKKAVQREHGVSLDTLSEQDPATAYDAFREALIGVLVVGRPISLDADTGMSVDAMLDNVEAQAGVFKKTTRSKNAKSRWSGAL